MESTVVNARIPQAKKDLGLSVLNSIGATTTELINGAFDYLIENNELPSGRTEQARDACAFKEFLSRSTLSIDWGEHPETIDYDEILREGRVADYEALA